MAEEIIVEDFEDDELLELIHKAACDVSFYNAAESPQWSRETTARNAAKVRFNVLKEECERRKLEWRKTEYLL